MTTSARTPERPAKPTLSAEHKRDLRSLGVTGPQLEWLQRVLPSIAWRLQARPRLEDVRDHLKQIDRVAKELAELVNRAARSPFAAEAIRHVDTAADVLASLPDDGTRPEVFDLASLMTVLTAPVAAALDRLGTEQRGGHADGAGAVEFVVRALARPTDDDSQLMARRSTPRARGTTGFTRIAQVVFSAATANPDWLVRDLRQPIEAFLKAGRLKS